MTRVAIYARQSVASDKGDSIGVQIRKCKDFIKATCEADEIEFIEYRDEGYSGSDTNRPGFDKLIKDIEADTIDMLACYRLDRITRSVADFANIQRTLDDYGIHFISVTERFDTTTDMGEAMMGIVVIFAQLERKTTRQRVIDNLLDLAKTGIWLGGEAPLGFKLKRNEDIVTKKKYTTLEAGDEDAVNKARFIYEKYLEFGSISKLNTFLLQNHIKTSKGKNFNAATLGRILRNPTYVKADTRIQRLYEQYGCAFFGEIDGEKGLNVYGKTKYIERKVQKNGKEVRKKFKITTPMDEWLVSVGRHKGIIETDLWLAVQDLLDDRKGAWPNVQISHTAIATTRLRCVCGSGMRIQPRVKNKQGIILRYYKCKMKANSRGVRCNYENVRADEVDQLIKNHLSSRALNKDKLLAELKNKQKQGEQDLINNHNPVEIIRSEIRKKESQIKKLIDNLSMIDNEIAVKKIGEDIELREKEIKQLYLDLGTIKEKKKDIGKKQNDIEVIESFLDKCGEVEELTVEEQRELVEAIYKKIIWDSEKNTLYFLHNGQDEDEANALLSTVLDGSVVSHSHLTTYEQKGHNCWCV